MARRTKISEVPELNKDEPIMLIGGILTKVFPVKSGENGTGPWSIQNAELKDASGTIKVMFKDRKHPVPDTWKGKEIVIESFHGEKGYSGVYAYDDNFTPSRGANAGKSQNTRIVKVTATGLVGLADDSGAGTTQGGGQQQEEGWRPGQGDQGQGGGQQQQRPASNGNGGGQSQGNQQRPAPQAQPQQQAAPPPAANSDPEKEVKKAVLRDALLFNICLAASNSVCAPAFTDQGITASEETIRTVATTFFIQASRRNDADKLPIPKKPPTAPAAAPDPEPRPAMTTQHPLAPANGGGAKRYNDGMDDTDDIPF